MATVTYTVRDFFAIPTGDVGGPIPSGVYVVTGSSSNLVINNNRGDLASDDPYGTGQLSNYGWFAGPNTSNDYELDAKGWGIIVGGDPNYTGITAADGRTSYISMWGFQGDPGDQTTYDTAFIALTNKIFGTSYVNTGSAKTKLQGEGYYYQYPQDLDGQSPQTGNGSDS